MPRSRNSLTVRASTRTRSQSRRPGGAAIARAVASAIKGAQSSNNNKKTNKNKNKNKNKNNSNFLESSYGRPMPASTGIGRVPKSIPHFSDLLDFTIAYSPADIVLGGATATTAPGLLGIAYWQGRGPSSTAAVLQNGLLPVVPSDGVIGRANIGEIIKHYSRRVYSKIVVHLTPEITATTTNGLFAIAAARGAGDAVNCVSSTSATAGTFSDTDIMTMKNAVPFRVYDSVEYDATWAIAGGSGPKQNEFDTSNTTNTAQTIVNNAIDGSGIVPCTLFMGGSANNAATSGTNVVTHRCIIQLTMHLLDYRGTVNVIGPLLKKPTCTCCPISELNTSLQPFIPPTPSPSPIYEDIVKVDSCPDTMTSLLAKVEALEAKFVNKTHHHQA